MQEAIWKPCSVYASEGSCLHTMRDHCMVCAPWWEYLPVCPHCTWKLRKYGKTKCKGCKKFVQVNPRIPEN